MAYGKRRAPETRTSWHIADGLSHVVYQPELARHRFYNDCSPDDVAWAQSLLSPQPVSPMVTPMGITEGSGGSVGFLHGCTGYTG